AAMAMAACAHENSPRTVTAPSQETAAPSSPAAPAVSAAPTVSTAPPQPEPQDDEHRARSTAPLPVPQSDPMPPPTPRCPSVGAPLVKASAVVKRESPSRARPPASPAILNIELTVTLPTNPSQVTFARNHLTVYGGVLVEQTLQPADRTKAIVLIRPFGAVAREGSLRASFGVACKQGEGYLRVDMTFASPAHEGDKVTIGGVDSY
ncbi:MAG TPA: hypothetical protein VGY54_19485, partial [Polyangiaceae bacterium]|nr:hypothetical protein [Polyangiaceae bacterium]